MFQRPKVLGWNMQRTAQRSRSLGCWNGECAHLFKQSEEIQQFIYNGALSFSSRNLPPEVNEWNNTCWKNKSLLRIIEPVFFPFVNGYEQFWQEKRVLWEYFLVRTILVEAFERQHFRSGKVSVDSYSKQICVRQNDVSWRKFPVVRNWSSSQCARKEKQNAWGLGFKAPLSFWHKWVIVWFSRCSELRSAFFYAFRLTFLHKRGLLSSKANTHWDLSCAQANALCVIQTKTAWAEPFGTLILPFASWG